jgi:hypothetical protein
VTDLDGLIAQAQANGYEIVQQGRITAPPKPGRSFSDRADGFMLSMLGTYPAPTYRSQFDNLLYDDAERWVHLRRQRR